MSDERNLAKSVEERLKGPAIGLLGIGLLGVFEALLSLVLAGFGHDINRWALEMMERQGAPVPPFVHAMLGGGALAFSVLQNALEAAVNGFLIYAAFQMFKVRSHGVCMAASILALVPCFGTCCLLGLPIGIWSLVELNRVDVRAAFTSNE